MKKPTGAFYDEEGMFRAYTTKGFDGVDLSRYFHELSFFEQMLPENYSRRYGYLEKIIDEANKEGVVFPDLCSEGNVLFNPRGLLGLVDYDGLQVGDDKSIVYLSSALGDAAQYENSKYKRAHGPLWFKLQMHECFLTTDSWSLAQRERISSVESGKVPVSCLQESWTFQA